LRARLPVEPKITSEQGSVIMLLYSYADPDSQCEHMDRALTHASRDARAIVQCAVLAPNGSRGLSVVSPVSFPHAPHRGLADDGIATGLMNT
jgi:hypothetical protein